MAEMTEEENKSDESDAVDASYLKVIVFEERLRCMVVVRHLLESEDVAEPIVLGSLRTLHLDMKLRQPGRPGRPVYLFFNKNEASTDVT